MPSVSKKQHNFMEAVAHSPKFAKKAGVPQSVGKDFAAADKGMKFKRGGRVKRYDAGGSIDDDYEDTNAGGYVRDSEGNRVRSESGFVTWGEGPTKRVRLSAAEIKPAKEMSAPKMAEADIKPARRIDIPVESAEPPKPASSATSSTIRPRPPGPRPEKAKVELSDEDSYGTPPPPRENRSEAAPPLPIKVPPLPGGGRVPPKPSAQALPPPEESKPIERQKLPPPRENRVKLPGPAKVETTFNDQGRKALPAPPRAALPAPETPKLPAPTSSQLQAELVRLQKADPGRRLGWKDALSLLPQGRIARAAAALGRTALDKLFSGEREALALPSPAKSTAVAKREVTAEPALRPPRPMPGRPDSDDKEEQRRKLEKKRREMAEGKTTNFAKGGFVKKSIDGCAQRGKTRGQMK